MMGNRKKCALCVVNELKTVCDCIWMVTYWVRAILLWMKMRKTKNCATNIIYELRGTHGNIQISDTGKRNGINGNENRRGESSHFLAKNNRKNKNKIKLAAKIVQCYCDRVTGMARNLFSVAGCDGAREFHEFLNFQVPGVLKLFDFNLASPGTNTRWIPSSGVQCALATRWKRARPREEHFTI